jgi:hypothetical protein
MNLGYSVDGIIDNPGGIVTLVGHAYDNLAC